MFMAIYLYLFYTVLGLDFVISFFGFTLIFGLGP